MIENYKWYLIVPGISFYIGLVTLICFWVYEKIQAIIHFKYKIEDLEATVRIIHKNSINIIEHRLDKLEDKNENSSLCNNKRTGG
jgi:hypothetical protein